MNITQTIALLLFLFSLTITGNQIKISVTSLGLPVIKICGGYELMVDTGSEQIWIADHACLECQRKRSICPLVGENTHQLAYYSGKIKGAFSYINGCGGRLKIICVRQISNFKLEGAEGIIGIKKKSTGQLMLSKYFQQLNLSVPAITFYHGLYENRVLLGEISQKYIKKQILVEQFENQEWSILCSQIIIQDLIINCTSLFFDTGSNALLLPKVIYDFVKSTIQRVMIEFKCNTSISSFQFYCSSNTMVNTIIELKISKNQTLKINLGSLMNKQGLTYSFRIIETNSSTIVIGVTLLRQYLIQFNLNSSLKIYEVPRSQLIYLENNTIKFLIIEYIIAILVLSWMLQNGYELINSLIDRKIVI